MIKKLLTILSAVLLITGMSGIAGAEIIGEGDFVSPTIIDFEDAPEEGLIDNFYAGSGVTFAHLDGYNEYDTGTGNGSSKTATNFFTEPNYPDGEASFVNPINKVGFFITTNPDDNTTIYAYLGDTLIGSEFFDTYGQGLGGSFAGIYFASAFDRIVIDTAAITNGAFAIDDFRFEAQPVPIPAAVWLFGSGILGLFGIRRKMRS
jgi:hypothetical protein